MADILSTWTPKPIKRDRSSALTLQGVEVYSDFDWQSGGPGFHDTKFPGARALDRELSRRVSRGERISVLLTTRVGVERELHRLDDGATCIVFGVDFLRHARFRRSTALVAGAADGAHALTALAAATENPSGLVALLTNPDWRSQVDALTGGEAAEHAPRVLHLANQALAKLPAGTPFDGEHFEALTKLFATLVAHAAKNGVAGKVVDLLDTDETTKLGWMRKNSALAAHLVRHEFTERDVVSLAHRRAELGRFTALLRDRGAFDAEKERLAAHGDESVWQQFFESNPWIFGTSLRLVCMSRFHEQRLEAVTTGSMVDEAGKRVDALMKTLGHVQSLCFIELKTHETKLVEQSAYRAECWAPSRELAGAIAQVQKTVHKAMLDVKFEPKDHDGFRLHTGFMFQPKAYVVIGSLSEFVRGEEVSEPKFGSFELYRRSLINPEIVTFDELLARATALLDHEETRLAV